jgi:hypothetical protein
MKSEENKSGIALMRMKSAPDVKQLFLSLRDMGTFCDLKTKCNESETKDL